MYCRSCGGIVKDQSEICTKCGCRAENGTEYCPKCGAKTTEKQAVCAECGYGLNMESFYASLAINFSAPLSGRKLSPYYQEEFKKIYNSKEAYKGKFNICGFLFGPLWALSKNRCTFEGIIALILCVLTAGLGCIIASIYFGCRGTYCYYQTFLITEKIAAWRSVTDLKK